MKVAVRASAPKASNPSAATFSLPQSTGRLLSYTYQGAISSWGPNGERQFTVSLHSSEVAGLAVMESLGVCISFDDREGKASGFW